MQIPFHRHALTRADADGVGAVLDTPFLTSGQVGRAVEAQLAERFDSDHALLTNSWTNGALAVLLALGVGPGDEVIVPAMTFVACANVVELLGARPVFADVDANTLLLTPDTMLPLVGARTRAVMPVHLYGQMADIAALRSTLTEAGRPDIRVIEDAAHCFEGSLHGRLPGQDSHAALFSFYATKNVTCGEGGAVVTRDSSLAERVRMTRLHGMSASAAERFAGGRYRHWDMVTLGVKANLPDILAALLPGQIARVDERLVERTRIARRYREAFAALGMRMPQWVPDAVHAHHLFPIHVPAAHRDHLLDTLGAHGVGATVNYRAVSQTAYYRQRYGAAATPTPVSDEWGAGTVSLPCFPGLTSAEQAYVIDTVASVVARVLEAV